MQCLSCKLSQSSYFKLEQTLSKGSAIITNVRKTKAAIRGGLQKKLFLIISQHSQENTCFGVSF